MKKSFLLLLLIPFVFYSCKTKDKTPPQIFLDGDNPMYVTLGDTYEEPGATADDNFDGAGISSKIESTYDIPNNSSSTTGDCVTKKHGDWTVTYTVTDKAGNSASATRTVKVRNEAYIYAISEFGFACVYNYSKIGDVNIMPNFSNQPVSLDFDERINNRIYFTKLAGKSGLRIYADIENDTDITINDQYKIFTINNGIDSTLWRVRGNVGQMNEILNTTPTSFHMVINYQLEYYTLSTTPTPFMAEGKYWFSVKVDNNTETYIQWE